MSLLRPLAVALQGLTAPFPLSAVAVAVQGLIAGLQASGPLGTNPTDAGKAGSSRDWAAENLRRLFETKAQPTSQPETYNLTRLHRDDADALEVIAAALYGGLLT